MRDETKEEGRGRRVHRRGERRTRREYERERRGKGRTGRSYESREKKREENGKREMGEMEGKTGPICIY